MPLSEWLQENSLETIMNDIRNGQSSSFGTHYSALQSITDITGHYKHYKSTLNSIKNNTVSFMLQPYNK